MENIALNPEMNLQVHARLIGKGTGLPLTGDAYRVKLFDRDFFEDDFLGESGLDESGNASITFEPSKMNSGRFEDALPDFFFVLYKNGEVIFQSKVMQDVDLAAIEQFKMGTGGIADLGSFLVEG